MTTKLSSVLIAMSFFCALPAFSRTQGNLRYSVVVDKFENKTEDQRALGEEWSTLLTSQLHESGHFIVVSQSDAQLAALKEQLRGASGVTTQGRKTAQRAQMTPVQLLVTGVITHLKGGAADQGGGVVVGGVTIGANRSVTEIRATLQMIDTSTGAVVAAKNFTGTAQGGGITFRRNGSGNTIGSKRDSNLHAAFEKATAEVIPWMVAQLPSVPWRGSVVKVDQERIIINRGGREGVSVGDEFVVGESEVLRDPDTGEVLDEIIRERARIKVLRVNDKTAVCSVVTGTIGQVVERMAVQHSNES